MSRAVDRANKSDEIVGCERLDGLMGRVLKSDSKLAVEREAATVR